MKTVNHLIESLLTYGLKQQLIESEDIIYMRNQLYQHLDLAVPATIPTDVREYKHIGELLSNFSRWASHNNLIVSNRSPYSDLFETAIMDIITPRPHWVNRQFWKRYRENPKRATEWFYQFSKATDYIKVANVAKNLKWTIDTKYGEMVITVNLSKPEKDPQAIAAAAKLSQSDYPKCMLCKENVGYQGRLDHPARQTHRVIDVELADEKWFMQYSPYVYYNEHAIIVKAQHQAMKVDQSTFRRLLDFLDILPHYFIGSNAGLPIVGGSLLTHDHYQGGHFDMPMATAKYYRQYGEEIFEGVAMQWLYWPLTALRISSPDKATLIEAAAEINRQWAEFEAVELEILAKTDQQHNAITPIARKVDRLYQLDMVLRNNRTNHDYPEGIFHPHRAVHPVKKENIGLIEVLGCAILPGRLKAVIEQLSTALEQNLSADQIGDKLRDFGDIYRATHARYRKGDNAQQAIKDAFGKVFLSGLEDAAVMPLTAAGEAVMTKFIAGLKDRA